MNGKKKLLLDCRGKPFYQYLLQALSGLERVYLSVDEQEPYRHLGLPMVEDRFPGTGPLGGIGSGLMCCRGQALFVVPCDTPFLTRSAVEKLLARYEQTGRPVFAEAEGHLQPLCGVYPPEVLPLVEQQLARQDYKLMHLLERLDYDRVCLEKGARELININTPEEYLRWVQNGEGPGTAAE